MLAEEKNQVVLVDTKGQVIGYEEKIKAHREGILHKAFSICIVNRSDEMLIQQRGLQKYHFAGLWSNACCSHPMREETIEKAAHRRLKEELGFDTEIKEAFSFIYKIKDEQSNLYEHEYDTVFLGIYEGSLLTEEKEINDIKWVSMSSLPAEIKATPSTYTEWFKIMVAMLQQHNLFSSTAIQAYLQLK